MTGTPAPRGFMGKRSHHAVKPGMRIEGEVVLVTRVVVAGPPPFRRGDLVVDREWRPKVAAS